MEKLNSKVKEKLGEYRYNHSLKVIETALILEIGRASCRERV